MNGKKAKRLRRELFTHDQWLMEKENRKYVYAQDTRGRDLPVARKAPGLLYKYQENKKNGR